MASQFFQDGFWKQWIPVWNIIDMIDGFTHGQYRTGIGQIDFNTAEKEFDLNGSAAAQTQFDNQSALQSQAATINAEEAQKQRDWEERMSNTQYQRMVADLKAANLNPWLALGNMGGAGTPSGSSAQVSPGSADMANNKLTAAAGVLAVVIAALLRKH